MGHADSGPSEGRARQIAAIQDRHYSSGLPLLIGQSVLLRTVHASPRAGVKTTVRCVRGPVGMLDGLGLGSERVQATEARASQPGAFHCHGGSEGSRSVSARGVSPSEDIGTRHCLDGWGALYSRVRTAAVQATALGLCAGELHGAPPLRLHVIQMAVCASKRQAVPAPEVRYTGASGALPLPPCCAVETLGQCGWWSRLGEDVPARLVAGTEATLTSIDSSVCRSTIHLAALPELCARSGHAVVERLRRLVSSVVTAGQHENQSNESSAHDLDGRAFSRSLSTERPSFTGGEA